MPFYMPVLHLASCKFPSLGSYEQVPGNCRSPLRAPSARARTHSRRVVLAARELFFRYPICLGDFADRSDLQE
jgi:hypothetical protein